MYIAVGLAVVAVVLGLVALLVRKALVVVTVDGYSMTPTLTHGDRVLALRRRFGGRPRRNSIVVARSPVPAELGSTPPPGVPELLLVKRVVALGGDADPRGDGVIPAGSVFIVGDSKYSGDSRTFGPISEKLVLGVVVRQMR